MKRHFHILACLVSVMAMSRPAAMAIAIFGSVFAEGDNDCRDFAIGGLSADGSNVAIGQFCFQLASHPLGWRGQLAPAQGRSPFRNAGIAASFDASVVVGEATTAAGQIVPAHWTLESDLEALLPEGSLSGSYGSALGVSRDRRVGGGEFGDEAFVWDAIQGARRLKSLSDTTAVARIANAVSADGSIVVAPRPDPPTRLHSTGSDLSSAPDVPCREAMTSGPAPR